MRVVQNIVYCVTLLPHKEKDLNYLFSKFAHGKFDELKTVQRKRKVQIPRFSRAPWGQVWHSSELIDYIFLTARWSSCRSHRVQPCWPTLCLILLEHWPVHRKCQRVFSWLLGRIQALSIHHRYNRLNGFQLLMGARARRGSADWGWGGNVWIAKWNIVEQMWSVTQRRKHDVQMEVNVKWVSLEFYVKPITTECFTMLDVCSTSIIPTYLKQCHLILILPNLPEKKTPKCRYILDK